MWAPYRHALDEQPPLPRTVPRPPAGRVLVVAPHPDDETFGLGGTLRLHVEQGDPVTVVFLTDGGFGDPDGHYAGRDYVALRREEARAAAAVLGLHEALFYGYPDRYPTITDAALEALAARLLGDVHRRRPDVLYFPWPGECHPDHRAAAVAVLKMLPRLAPSVRAVGYEVWSAMVPDWIVDVTPAVGAKLRAARCYESQLRYTPYLAVTEGLMTYRSLHFHRGPEEAPRYGEAFLEVRAP